MIKIIIVVLLVFSLPIFADIEFNFESSTEGWQIADFPVGGPYTAPLGYYTTSYIATGGNPGGFLRGHDPTSNSFSFSMPESAFDCVNSLHGGNISFSLRCSANNWDDEPYLILVCGTEMLISEFAVPWQEWEDYSIDFIVENFYLWDGADLTSEHFENLLQNVDNLYIIAEFGGGVYEDTDLDSVILSGISEDVIEAPELTSNLDPIMQEIILSWNAVPSAVSYLVYESAEPHGAPENIYPVTETIITLPVTDPMKFYFVKSVCGEI
jgi:hypothetical protein